MRLRREDVSARTLGDQTIVLDLRSSRYLTVSGVGVRLFELLAEERSLAELTDSITSEYEVDDERALQDTTAFLDALRAASLLEG
ncbi:MAG: PqqD family protein [Pseudonocardia sp.]